MVIIKAPEEIEKIRTSSRIAAEVLKELESLVEPGIRTMELEQYAEALAARKKVRPAFKGYNGFPFGLCVSVNEEVVHGMPSKRVLREGDIVSLDYGVFCNGYYGDTAITVPVGKISEESSKLLKATREGLYRGIDETKEGNRLGDISAAIQNYVESAGFSVVRDYVGHGIGKSLHEDPQVPNYGIKGRGMLLKKGMVLAIEPMVNAGKFQIKVLKDHWTVVTEDGKNSAHFEHTVAITDKGPEILSYVN
ncbi:MAG: Methionine aminopeptidase 1 [Syntrophus sp. PtaU1.Bin005]|jgi:methionyl aminopeptidase|uniref:type I methionyl aminopeptidase n=1 Tax=Syntrophus TaxID=43773 RepID=UPI0009C78852|nr:MAG: Methionine aminopeptidase 1 [Syntrophus sp. PtaB.Bin138]OPY81542.1 MAG: Methionine aminopeptidase 1 [Syntrophus sp. PtaU1.Bin005]